MRTRLYRIWLNMRHRCNGLNINKSINQLCYIGVTCCKEWDDFEAFEIWALVNGYQEHLTIDRKDNKKGYSPNNCRWITRIEQIANRRVYGASKFRGVAIKGNKWKATIDRKHLGTFETELAAALAYDKAAKEILGDSARLNFPERHK